MSSTPQLTPRDVSLLAIAFQSLKDDSALQIDYTKFAELAGYKTAASANACFLLVKKKLLGGANVSNATTATTPKKAKGKATNPENEDENEATPTKVAMKKRAKAIKTEPVDAEAGDADTEATPSAESPKKGRAKKATGAAANAEANAEANGDATAKATTNGDTTNDAAATEVTAPNPKRKRGPNKPKDPNATPTKRAKKGANAGATAGADGDAANDQLHGDETTAQTNGEGSIFGGDANVKEEEGEEEGDDRPFDAEEQKMADDALFNTYTIEEQAA